MEAHEQLKKRLFDLLQRNREFRALLLASNFKQTQTGGINFTTLAPADGPDIFSSLSSFFDVVSINKVIVCLLFVEYAFAE